MSDSMNDDSNNKNPFGEKTIVHSSKDEATVAINQSNEKTMVFAQSNLKEHFDARTVVRSSKPMPATLPEEAPAPMQVQAQVQAKVIAAEVPPAVATPVSDGDTNPSIEKPKLTKDARREARAALDRKTRGYMMAFGAVVVMAISFVVVGLGSKSSDKPGDDVAQGPGPAATTEKKEMASESDAPPAGKNPARDPQMLGAYKTTTDVLKDFDRASKKAQDHSVGF